MTTLGEFIWTLNEERKRIEAQHLPEGDMEVYNVIHESYVNKVVRDFQVDSGQRNAFNIDLSETQREELDRTVLLPLHRESQMLMRGLPLYSHKLEIVKTIAKNKVSIIVSHTGSGKSTQLPQYLHFHPISRGEQIVCTQPRKIAAKAMSNRVNFELGDDLAKSMLYFESWKVGQSESAPILYASESAFMKYLLTQKEKSVPAAGVSILIVDEAHERTIEGDIILGLIKRYVLPKRRNFRLVITSASIHCEQFKTIFQDLQVAQCLGTMFPVTEYYLREYSDYFTEVIKTIERIIIGLFMQDNLNQTILAFLTGQDELSAAKRALENGLSEHSQDVTIYLFHGRIHTREQNMILRKNYESPREIIVILATNLAESSLTVPNVTIVIDSCREKKPRYIPERKATELQVRPVSKAAAIQRKGRAGRTCPGACYRMITEEEYANLPDYNQAAILQSNLASVIMRFLSYNILLTDFPLINKPEPETIKKVYRELYLMGAIEGRNDTLVPTVLGKLIAEVNIDPQCAKAFHHGHKQLGCSLEILQLTSYLQGASFLFRWNIDLQPQRPRFAKHEFFSQNYLTYPGIVQLGDMYQALFIFRQFLLTKCWSCRELTDILWVPTNCRTCRKERLHWAQVHNLEAKGVTTGFRIYTEIHRELTSRVSDQLRLVSAIEYEEREAERFLANYVQAAYTGCSTPEGDPNELIQAVAEAYRRASKNITAALFSGFFSNTGYSRGVSKLEQGYIHLGTKEVFVPHPSSQYARTMNCEAPEFLIYFNVVVSTNRFMKFLTPVDPTLLSIVSDRLFEFVDFDSVKKDYTVVRFPSSGKIISERLLGHNGEGLYELEQRIHNAGALGTYIYIEAETQELVLIVAADFEDTARPMVAEYAEQCKEDAIGSERFQYTYSPGIILIVGVGAVVCSIQESHNALTYQVANLRKPENVRELTRDFKNLFKCQSLSIKENEQSAIATVYFTSEEQVNYAQQALANRPMPGVNGPVTVLTPLENMHIRIGLILQIAVPSRYQNPELVRLFRAHDSVTKVLVSTSRNSKEVSVFFASHAGIRAFIDKYPQWATEKFGVGWGDRLSTPCKRLLLPRPLKQLDLPRICEALCEELKDAEIKLDFKDILKGYIKVQKSTPETLRTLNLAIQPELVPLQYGTFKSLRNHRFSDRSSWAAWQRRMQVVCEYNSKRNALEIHGHPLDRAEARSILEPIIMELDRCRKSHTLCLKNIQEYLKVLRKLRAQNAVWFQTNRRDSSIVLTGHTQDIDALLKTLKTHQTPSQSACIVCYQNYDRENEIKLALCGHNVHLPCLRLQVLNQMKTKPCPDLPLVCLMCELPLVREDWCRVLTTHEVDELYYASILHYIATDPSETYALCEGPDCGAVYNRSHLRGDTTRICIQCGGTYCRRCKQEVFGNTHPSVCEMSRISEEYKETARWISQHAQQCPTCRFPVQKNGGCNHITCPRCRTHYCFICGVVLDPQAPTNHFLEQTSPCYTKLFDGSGPN